MNSQDTFRPQLDRVERQALLWGVVGLALCVIFFFRDRNQFFQSYLMAYIYWVAIPLGSLAILMLHHMTGGWWGYPLRRILEASSRTFWVMVAFYIPLWFGMSRLYAWTKPDAIPDDSLHHFKKVYLTSGFFTARTVIYFVILLALVYVLNKRSMDQDRTGDPNIQAKLGTLCGPGIILWGLIVSAAAFDWVMSLEPEWFSTIYGLIFIVLEALVALSFTLFVLGRLSDREPLKDVIRPSDYNDLGNLMLAFLMLLTYLSFDQFLLIYSGNLRDEIPWYLTRQFGGWGYVASFLLVFHFFVPFLLLLQRSIKRNLRLLSRVAAFLIVLTLVDVYWLVVPSLEKTGPHFHFMDLFALVGIGGIWVAAFARQLKRLPILPLHDPRFEGVLLHEHGD